MILPIESYSILRGFHLFKNKIIGLNGKQYILGKYIFPIGLNCFSEPWLVLLGFHGFYLVLMGFTVP